MENNFFYFILFSYLIGSIPFAYILTKIFGYGDIRKIGSGNVGATNVLRTGKKSLAIFVLFLDIIKGYLPITFFLYFCVDQFELYKIIFFASFALLGHIFPIWLKFKGGKGVATYLGFILGIDYVIGIIFITIWLITALLKKFSSLASILSILAIPVTSYYLSYNYRVIIIFILISIVILIKHYSNIKRLLSKSENKIKF